MDPVSFSWALLPHPWAGLSGPPPTPGWVPCPPLLVALVAFIPDIPAFLEKALGQGVLLEECSLGVLLGSSWDLCSLYDEHGKERELGAGRGVRLGKRREVPSPGCCPGCLP